MKIFRLILILALGLQIGFGEGENSGSGQNVSNTNEDYKYYLKYQSKSIVNDGECQKCDDIKDGFVAIQYHYDDITGTTYCNVYKNTDWNNPIGTAHRQVKSCSYYNSESAKEAQNIIQKMSETNKKSADIISAIGSKDNKFTDNSNGITFTEFLVGLVTLNPNFINRNSIAGENFLKQTLNSNVYTSASNDMNVI